MRCRGVNICMIDKIINSLLSFLLVVLFASVSNFVNAQEQKEAGNEMDILLEEFPLGEPVFVQEKFEVQLTSGVEAWSNSGEKMEYKLPFLMEYGITDKLQFEVEAKYAFMRDSSDKYERDLDDIELGLLYNLMLKKSFSLSVGFNAGRLNSMLPSDKGKPEPIKRKVEWEPSVIMARQFGKGQIHAGAGLGFTENETEFAYNISGIYPINRFKPTLELNGRIEDDSFLSVTPGFIWTHSELFELAFGMPVNTSLNRLNDNPEWGLILRLTFEFEILDKD